MTTKSQSQEGKENTRKQRSKQPDPPGLDAQGEQVNMAATLQRARSAPGSLTPHQVQQLQRTIGNQMVGKLLAGSIQRQAVQPKLIGVTPKENSYVDLIKAHTTQKQKVAEIISSPNFNVTLSFFDGLKSDTGEAGKTIADLYKVGENDPFYTINSMVNLYNLDKNIIKLVDRMEVGVILYGQETRFSDETPVPKDPAGEVLSLVHEFERHVIPYYDMFLEVMTGKFETELSNDESRLDTLAHEAKQTTGAYSPSAQHMSPQLSANTLATTFSYIDSLGGGQDDLKRKLLFRLYMDTIHRGVNPNGLLTEYNKLGQHSPTAHDFGGLIGKLNGAISGKQQPQYVPAPNVQVIIVDGAYMGHQGVVTGDVIPPDLRQRSDEIVVKLQDGDSVGLPKSWCFFLR